MPASLNLFAAAGFRYQDPNYYACTATSVMDMLNFIKIAGTGGRTSKWEVRLGLAARDSILAWTDPRHPWPAAMAPIHTAGETP